MRSPERLTPESVEMPDGDILPVDDVPGAEDMPVNEDIIEDMVLGAEAEAAEAEEVAEATAADPYEAFWAIFDEKDSANRSSTFDARREAIAEAQRRGIKIPPDLS